MKISLENTGKRYQRYWVFKGLSCTYEPGERYALLGPNGSGKSTLLRIIGGLQPPSEGKLSYETKGKAIPATELFEHISFCAPGMEIPDELNLLEFLDFHFSFKKMLPGLNIPAILELTGLKKAASRPIADYSSGMRQRVKLAQALFSDTPLLLLDEPCTNLDESGVLQYLEWVKLYARDRTIIVASNDEREYSYCSHSMHMHEYQ